MFPGFTSVKVGATTLRGMVVVTVRLPEVPVMVSVLVPPGAEALALTVSVVVPDVGLGEKDAVTPLGRPETARLTLPVNPYSGATVMVLVVDAPGFTWRLPEEVEMAKVGAWTTTVTGVVAV